MAVTNLLTVGLIPCSFDTPRMSARRRSRPAAVLAKRNPSGSVPMSSLSQDVQSTQCSDIPIKLNP